MQDRNPIPPFDQSGTPGRVCVADGHGIKIRVDRRHLVVEDGIGRSRRTRRFHKGTTDLRRLIILGTTGYISLEASRWLADAAIPLTQIDPEGRLLVTSQPIGSDRAALRRAQAWALTNESGLEVVRYLLDRKLEGQAHIAQALDGHRSAIDKARHELETAGSLNELLWLEANAANHYWHAWADVECGFIKRDLAKVPDHWRRLGTRGSNFNSSGPRGAANPINAMLNYLYALLEAEAVIACQTVGLDPGVGVLHADQRARDSFALDLMEPARPLVDQWVLRLIQKHKFKATDFSETRRGICRLKPHISHWFAETTSEWAASVAPHAEHVAQTLAGTPGVRIDRIPTPLTGATRSESRPTRDRPSKPRSSAPSHCHNCGAQTNAGRNQCDECLPLTRGQHLETMVSSAHDRLREMRAAGDDPAHGGNPAQKRGTANRVHQLAVHEWNAANGPADRDHFAKEILPLLKEISLGAIARATGLSKGYCSFIRRGIKTPHQRHWKALQDLASLQNKPRPASGPPVTRVE